MVGTNWQLREMRMECELCGCAEEDDGGNVNCCDRTHWRYQIPMRQLYFDLELPSNQHMTMAQKRFTCYKFYTKVKHGVLTTGDRSRVCACVDEEIGNKFPRQEGVNRVGFRE